MTLRDYLLIVRARWKLVSAIVLLTVTLASLITAITPVSYRAQVQLYATANISSSDPLAQFQAVATTQSQVSTYAQLIDTPTVLNQIRNSLHITASDTVLKGKLTAVAPSSSALINVYATDANAARAADIANIAARALIRSTKRYLTPTGATEPTVRIFVSSPASTPASPTSPRPSLNIALGIFVGLLLGIALAVVRDAADDRIKDPEEFAMLAMAPVMGLIVDDKDAERFPIATRSEQRSVRAENFRQVRANLQFAAVDRPPRIIAIASAVPGEGKTMVALNIASALAEAGFTVCLVDADLRLPTVASSLGLVSEIGLTTVLINQVSLEDALQVAGQNLYVLPAGQTPPNPSELLASAQARDVINGLLDRVDYIILDAAPLLPVSDGAEIAAMADATILVACYDKTTQAQVERAVGVLAAVDVAATGLLLNRVPAKVWRDDFGHDYGNHTTVATAPVTPKRRIRLQSRRDSTPVR